MSNYPKMLYKGDQESYQTVIADDEDHEAELTADGWANYGELPNPSVEDQYAETVDKSSDPIGFVPTEQFDALALKVAELEEENAQLKEVIENGSAENKGLQDQIAVLKSSIQNPESITSNSEPKVISLNDLTLAQLQEMAESKGIAFKVRDSKGTLIELLMDYQDKELANANQTA